jgi:hypothetical protein
VINYYTKKIIFYEGLAHELHDLFAVLHRGIDQLILAFAFRLLARVLALGLVDVLACRSQEGH